MDLKKISLGSFALLILSFFSLDITAQTIEQQQTLQKISAELSQKFQQQRAAAIKRADSLNIPVYKEYDDGQVVVLVNFEEGRPVYKTTHNAAGADLTKTYEVYKGGAANLSLSGKGQAIGLWDAGNPRMDHAELGGRIVLIDNIGTDGHATHVGGTLIAAGIDPDAKGMAPEGTVHSYDFLTDQTDMPVAAANGLNVSVHPYGYQVGWVRDNINENPGWYWRGSAGWEEDYNFGYYDSDNAQTWDQISYNAPHYLIVNSAGNDRGKGPGAGDDKYEFNGSQWVLCSPNCSVSHEINGESDGAIQDGYDTLSDNSIAKNVITVGAVDGSKNMYINSNWGPTDDGRIKPDLVAKGVSVYSSNAGSPTAYGNRTGTSHSAPMIAGSIALLLEHQKNLHPGEKLLSSTLKALIFHTATDLGYAGPDYQFGWGLMNTQKAAGLMSLNSMESRIHIRELTLDDGQTITIPVKSKGLDSLRATIVWTDPAGTPVTPISEDATDPMLVNDLDMKIQDESSTIYQPYMMDLSDPNYPDISAGVGDNVRDNVEMVHINSPAKDEIYTITISHKGTLTNGSQDVSLIISGNEGINYQQQIAEGNDEGWRFLSSPALTTYHQFLDPLWTQGSNKSDDPSASFSNVRIYEGSTFKPVSDLASSIRTGSGFAVFVYADDETDNIPDGWPKTVSVTGMQTPDDLDVSEMLNTGNNNFTLLGNPFNTTIDFDEFSNKNDLGSTIYVYGHSGNGGAFRVWNSNTQTGNLSDGLIPPFQGFFVYATGSDPSLTIPLNSKSDAFTNSFKDTEKAPMIYLSAKFDDKLSSDTWFSFSESGSMQRNIDDAPYLYPLDYDPFLSFKSEIDGEGFKIKNLPFEFDHPLDIPVSLAAWQPNEDQQNPGYIPNSGPTILTWPEIRNIPGEWTLTLTDHYTGSIIDLRRSSRYSFNLDSKSNLESLPYKMMMNLSDSEVSGSSRFTLSVYPEPYITEKSEEIPSEFTLQQNYPNPFNPSTVIRYSLPEDTSVELNVYTIDGQKVATLVDEPKSAGNHVATFQAPNLSSGVYIYRLSAGQKIISKKMILIK